MIPALAAEIGPLWQARQEARLVSRSRAPGAGAKYRLVFVDRLPATLVHLRHTTTHDVLAAWFGVDRSTITRAINEIRPLLAERGCQVEDGRTLRTLAEVVDHLSRDRNDGIVDATEVRVRRPAVDTNGRDRFVSGKSKQNAIKTMIVTDEVGRMLFCGTTTPGSTADITQARQAGLGTLLKNTMGFRILAEAGDQGSVPKQPGRWSCVPHNSARLEGLVG